MDTSSFIVRDEEMTEIRKAVDKLKAPVQELNKKISQFSELALSGFVKFPLAPLPSLPSDYNDAYMRWLQDGAIDDFVDRMEKPYEHFDAEAYENATMEAEDSQEAGAKLPDPQLFVSKKKRIVILGFLGSIWIDLPVSGLVKGVKVTKWTRAAFQYHDDQTPPFWTVRLDPTTDEKPFQPKPSADFVRQMVTNNMDINITF